MSTRHFYEFGGFRLDPQDRILLNKDERVRLEPKDLEILLVLVENHGRTIGKDELLQKVWPGTFVEEGNLARHISTLRQVLSDQQNGPKYIETIPKRGYRFVAAVREIGVDLAAETASPRGSIAPPSHTILRLSPAAVLAVAGLVLLLASGVVWVRSRKSPISASQYTQLTNYADSATSPALSSDGHMLAFVRGENTFFGHGEIYVKFLPDGDSFQLTHDSLAKMSPVFSPDGARIAYTVVDRGAWDTWLVPVPGGVPRRRLANASGLTWIGDQRVMFSEMTQAFT